jgi:hypothetical protein
MREHLCAPLRFSEPNTHAEHESHECTLMRLEILNKLIQRNLNSRALDNSVRGRMPQAPYRRTTAEFPERMLRLYELQDEVTAVNLAGPYDHLTSLEKVHAIRTILRGPDLFPSSVASRRAEFPIAGQVL